MSQQSDRRSKGSASHAHAFQKDFLTYLPARLLPAASGLATVMILSRLFPPSVYGRYALVLGAAGIALAVLSGWLRECVVRFYPLEKREEAENGLLLRVALLSSLISLLPLVGLAVLAAFPNVLFEYRSLAVWAILWTAIGILTSPLSSMLRASLQVRSYVFWEIMRALTSVALIVVFVAVLRKPIHWTFIAMVVTSLGSAIGMGWALRAVPRLKQGWSVWSRAAARIPELARYGLPMAGWAIGVRVLSLADRFILEWFHGSEAVGIYASNYYLAEGGTALLMASILAAAKPRIMHGAMEAKAGHSPPLLGTVTRLTVLLLLPAVVAVLVLGRHLAVLLLDPEYVRGYAILPIIVGGTGLWSLGELGQTTLQLVGRTRTLLVGVLGCSVLNVVLNLLVVPRWGYLGAAWTTLASYAAYPVFIHLMARRVSRWTIPWDSVARGVLASSVLAGALVLIWSMPVHLAYRVAVTSLTPIVYLAALVVLGETAVRDMLGWIRREIAKRFRGGDGAR